MVNKWLSRICSRSKVVSAVEKYKVRKRNVAVFNRVFWPLERIYFVLGWDRKPLEGFEWGALTYGHSSRTAEKDLRSSQRAVRRLCSHLGGLDHVCGLWQCRWWQVVEFWTGCADGSSGVRWIDHVFSFNVVARGKDLCSFHASRCVSETDDAVGWLGISLRCAFFWPSSGYNLSATSALEAGSGGLGHT